ncbi:TetR/AcrR family transcriptional regulator [bacterium]|nr:TetR/AcrR family transcriptional regulator [bacterium]
MFRKTPVTREGIIRAAESLLAHRPVSLLRIREVAKAAKVAPSTIYDHFTDKDELLQAVWELEQERFNSELDETLRHTENGINGLVALGYTIFADFDRYAQNRVRGVELLRGLKNQQQARQLLAENHAAQLNILEDALSVGHPDLTEQQVRLRAGLLLSLLNGLALTHLHSPDPQLAEELFGELLSLLEQY